MLVSSVKQSFDKKYWNAKQYWLIVFSFPGIQSDVNIFKIFVTFCLSYVSNIILYLTKNAKKHILYQRISLIIYFSKLHSSNCCPMWASIPSSGWLGTKSPLTMGFSCLAIMSLHTMANLLGKRYLITLVPYLYFHSNNVKLSWETLHGTELWSLLLHNTRGCP